MMISRAASHLKFCMETPETHLRILCAAYLHVHSYRLDDGANLEFISGKLNVLGMCISGNRPLNIRSNLHSPNTPSWRGA
jgi:hypothetical protein